MLDPAHNSLDAPAVKCGRSGLDLLVAQPQGREGQLLLTSYQAPGWQLSDLLRTQHVRGKSSSPTGILPGPPLGGVLPQAGLRGPERPSLLQWAHSLDSKTRFPKAMQSLSASSTFPVPRLKQLQRRTRSPSWLPTSQCWQSHVNREESTHWRAPPRLPPLREDYSLEEGAQSHGAPDQGKQQDSLHQEGASRPPRNAIAACARPAGRQPPSLQHGCWGRHLGREPLQDTSPPGAGTQWSGCSPGGQRHEGVVQSTPCWCTPHRPRGGVQRKSVSSLSTNLQHLCVHAQRPQKKGSG